MDLVLKEQDIINIIKDYIEKIYSLKITKKIKNFTGEFEFCSKI